MKSDKEKIKRIKIDDYWLAEGMGLYLKIDGKEVQLHEYLNDLEDRVFNRNEDKPLSNIKVKDPITEKQRKLFDLMCDPKHYRSASIRELSRLMGYPNIEPVARWINLLKYKGYLDDRNMPIK